MVNLKTTARYCLGVYLYLRYLMNRILIFFGITKVQYGIVDPFIHSGVLRCGFVHNYDRLEEVFRFDKFRPDDVIIATYPKSGTIFTIGLVSTIYREYYAGTDKKGSGQSLDTRMPRLFRYLEGDFSKDGPKRMDYLDSKPSPRLFTTHFPYSVLPTQVTRDRIKVIYCRRNPKDVACSAFHYYKTMSYMLPGTTWSDFIQWFMEGNVLFGSYFYHLKRWYNHFKEPNVLCLEYEELKKDLEGVVRRLEKFLEISLTQEQVDRIVSANTFQNRKNDPVVNRPFYRKGKSGGWMSEFTVEQNQMMDEWIKEEMKGMKDLDIKFQ